MAIEWIPVSERLPEIDGYVNALSSDPIIGADIVLARVIREGLCSYTHWAEIEGPGE